jgi:hypothetical protein
MSFYRRNIPFVIFATVISIDVVAMQTDFLASLHLFGEGARRAYMGWLGGAVLLAICVYPIVYYLLAWRRFIPAKVAWFLEPIPYFAFGLWLVFVGYLAFLTEFETVTFPLRSDFSMENSTVIYNQAQAKGIPMSVVFESRRLPTAWTTTKYEQQVREIFRPYLAEQ